MLNFPYISCDLGGSRMKVGIFQENHLLELSVSDIADTNNSEQWLSQLEREIEDLLQKNTGKNNPFNSLAGLAIAYAGPVNCREKKLLPSNGKYQTGPEINLVKWAKKYTKNLILDNDARMACIGEWQYGAGKDYRSLVTVTLGTGIGTSCIINNRVLRGSHDLAGCLGGHFTVSLEDTLCTCGNKGCVETLASTAQLQYLQKDYIDRDKIVQSFNEIFELAREEEHGFPQVEKQIFKIWGAALVNYIHAYDPEIVILSGGIMSDNATHILDNLNTYVQKHAWTLGRPVPLKAGYAEEAALWGGLYLLEQGEENVTL